MPPESTLFDKAAPLTPCIGVCTLDAAGLCIGCRRTMAEIARWGTLGDDERRRWMRDVQPTRPPPKP